MQSIYIHELLDPKIYIRGRSALIELFKKWTGSPSVERLFQVTQTGMIYFTDHGELWRDSEERRALPETAEDALKQAERFLADIRTQFNAKNSEGIRKALEVCPIPDVITRIDAVAVLHPRFGLVDHWLCRFAIHVTAFQWERPAQPPAEPEDPVVPAVALAFTKLADPLSPSATEAEDPLPSTDRSKPLRIQDALIEVRIGSKWGGTDRYRIIGYNQRWRPLKSEKRITTELYPPVHEEEKGKEHDEDAVEPVLVYVLDADSQRYLAPYYLTPSGHHFGFQAASQYSLVLNAIQADTETGTKLLLNVDGGGEKRNFTVHWSYWRPDTFAAEGFIHLGEGIQAPTMLPPAVYNVIADVTDMETGQMKRHQQTVYAKIKVAEPVSSVVY